MPSGIISGSHSTAVTLTTASYLNPVTVTGTITVGGGGGNALFGAAPTAWTVDNKGQITTADTAAAGIFLDAGGSVANGEAAIISGGRDGIYITGGAGAVTDYASISGGVNAAIELHDGGSASITSTGRVTGGARGVAVYNAPGTLMNQGRIGASSTLGDAVFMRDGGYVLNAAGARIGTVGTGINIYAGAGTVVNDGTVTGEGSAGIEGVAIGGGGSVTNGLGAVIDGYYAGIALSGGFATVVDDGAVAGTGGANAIGIRVASGATVSIGGSGTVSGIALGMDFFNLPGTVTNAGMIAGGATGSGAGIVLNAGGTVMNATGATIMGAGDGIYGLGSPVIVTDLGHITGLGRIGVNLRGGGAVTVAGGVTGYLDGVAIGSGAGRVTNSGDIIATSTTGSGVALLAGGTVTNDGGSIRGPIDGVYITGGYGKVVNSGAIGANVADAVRLAAGFFNQVVAQPGGVFDGVVDGGNTIGASVVSTLELAAGTSAGVVGMIGGLGYGFTNFAAITIDSGAIWDLTASNTIAAGVALLDSGQLNLVFGNLANAGELAGQVNVSLASVFTNQVSGTVTGPAGVSMEVTDLGFRNAGAINGGNYGVIATPGDSVTNSGRISAGIVAVEVGGGPPGSAISLITNQTGARIAAGTYGIEIIGGGATIDNAGTITATVIPTKSSGILLDAAGSVFNSGSIGEAAYGVRLVDGGYLSNASTGVIAAASRSGIYAKSGVATVINAGSIYNFSTDFSAVELNQGGSIDNEAGAVITSTYRAVYTGYGTTGGAGTVTNAGTISNTHLSHTALIVEDGGSVLNTGLIDSTTRGVYFGGGGTLTNSGTIAGTANLNEAVYFHGGFANRLIVDPGAVFTGTVTVGSAMSTTAASTLELAAGAGALSGIGTSFVNFGSIVFDPAAQWTISGSTAGLAGGQVFSGFAHGDAIELTGVTATKSGLADGTLSLSGGIDLRFPGTGYTYSQFLVAKADGNTEIAIACFVAGTRILTEAGEVAVEALRTGDVVASAFGGMVPVVWLGHRRVDCRRHADPQAIWPVRVTAGAFGAGRPRRDLWLSRDHAVFVGGDGEGAAPGVLIPIRHLVNGASIAQVPCDSIEYWHVELPAHDVILAEGLPAESYLDTGNRAAFANGGAAVQMNADFALRVWEREACAKLLVDGPAVVAVRERLHARAEQLGWTTTDAPAPMLFAGGQQIAPDQHGDDVVTFRLPPRCRRARLLSRAAIAANLLPCSTDHRRLGLAVTALVLDGAALPLDSARLGAGWHAPEPGLRWTDGAAELTLAGERKLTVRFARLLRYWSDCPADCRGASPTGLRQTG